MPKRARVACVGVAVLDYIYQVPRLPSNDEKLRANGRATSGGGMAAGAAVTVVRLGGDAAWFGRIGDDDTAEQVLSAMRAESVRVDAAKQLPDAPTPHSLVLVDQAGNRAIVAYRAQPFPTDTDWLPLDVITEYDAVLADVSWPEGSTRALRAARAKGLPAILDGDVFNFQGREEVVSASSHTVFSQQGLRELSGCTDPFDGLRIAAELTPFVAVTLGAGGVAWLDHQGRPCHIPAHEVAAKETLGAGDVFHGAFALGLAEGEGGRGSAALCESGGRDQVCPKGRLAELSVPGGGGCDGWLDENETAVRTVRPVDSQESAFAGSRC